MNSLENLNNWSNDHISYEDQLAYSITFTPSSPTNQTVSIVEDSVFASPTGTNITSVDSAPRPLEYKIDLSSSGITYPIIFNCPTLPAYLSSTIVNGNIFKVTGYIDENSWQTLQNITIQIIDQSSFSYTSTITYPDPTDTANDLTKSWTVGVTVTNSPQMSSPTNYSYIKNSPGTIAGSPTILNASSGPYTLVITPSNTAATYTFSSNGSGGTSTFDPVDKTLTLSGTKTQVNSHLSSIVFTPSSNSIDSFTVNYTLTNPTGLISSVIQNFSGSDAFVLNQATYVEDVPFNIQQSIKDQSATATSFTLSLAQSTPLPSVSPGYFTVNGSNVGNTWSISNTKTTINSANVIYTPPVDYSGTLTFTVNLSKVDNGNTVNQVTNGQINIVNTGLNPEISNMINRSYTANTVNNIFSSQTPYINDGADTGQSYAITLISSLGKFGNSAANAAAAASYSFTGNMTAVNSQFSSMVFVPTPGAAGSTGTYTYTQTRNGTLQVNNSYTLSGFTGNVTPATYTFTAGNSTFTPSFLESYYGNTQILVVGGGGGGGGGNTATGGGGYAVVGGGGGGGGGVVLANLAPNTYMTGTFTITVGTGGLYRQGHTNAAQGSGYSNGADGTASGLSNGTVSYQSNPGGGGNVSTANSALSTGGSSGGSSTRSPFLGGSGANFGLGGGGGGANSVGGNAVAQSRGGFGGSGFTSNISGTSITYSKGGNGGESNVIPPTNGNTPGSGGGGGKQTSSSTGNGADGIVIIRIR